jgi:hypothetical protein
MVIFIILILILVIVLIFLFLVLLTLLDHPLSGLTRSELFEPSHRHVSNSAFRKEFGAQRADLTTTIPGQKYNSQGKENLHFFFVNYLHIETLRRILKLVPLDTMHKITWAEPHQFMQPNSPLPSLRRALRNQCPQNRFPEIRLWL